MFPIKKILCPTDFSEPSDNGLAAAVELSDKFSSELILFHAVPPLPVTAGASPSIGETYTLPTVTEELRTESVKKMNELVESSVPDHITCHSSVVYGKPAEEIVNLAEKESADMIVIATHGESGWRRFLFGSVAEKVVRSAECPVLTIREPRQK